MNASSNHTRKPRIQSKIRFLEEQLDSLDHYLPETYDYLMAELDQQRRQLAEIEAQETFRQIESDHQHQTPQDSLQNPTKGKSTP